MIEQTPVDKPEDKPDDAPKPAEAPSTALVGNGPADGFGLNAAGSARLGGSGGGGGSRWGWYASQVQIKIQDALGQNPRTRNASLRVDISIWPDATGRVTRAQLKGTTGDLAIDTALRDEVLTGLQLQEPPPAGMPLPIVLRVTARRPN